MVFLSGGTKFRPFPANRKIPRTRKRRPCTAGTQPATGRLPSGREAAKLVGRQGQDAKHQLAKDLGRPPDAHMAAAKRILEGGVHPLHA